MDQVKVLSKDMIGKTLRELRGSLGRLSDFLKHFYISNDLNQRSFLFAFAIRIKFNSVSLIFTIGYK